MISSLDPLCLRDVLSSFVIIDISLCSLSLPSNFFDRIYTDVKSNKSEDLTTRITLLLILSNKNL